MKLERMMLKFGMKTESRIPTKAQSWRVKADPLLSKKGRSCGWNQTMLVLTSSRRSFYNDFYKLTQTIPTNVFWFERIRSWAEAHDPDQVIWDVKQKISITWKFVRITSKLGSFAFSLLGRPLSFFCTVREPSKADDSWVSKHTILKRMKADLGESRRFLGESRQSRPKRAILSRGLKADDSVGQSGQFYLNLTVRKQMIFWVKEDDNLQNLKCWWASYLEG